MLPALAFLANPAFWAGVSKVLPAVAGMMGGGGGQAQQANTIGGQAQPQQPMNQFIPPQLMQSRQMPSYGSMINQMLQQQRRF